MLVLTFSKGKQNTKYRYPVVVHDVPGSILDMPALTDHANCYLERECNLYFFR